MAVALQHWLQLAMTDGVGPILLQRMISAAGSAEAACAMNERALQNVDGIGSAKSRAIASSLREAADAVEGELTKAESLGVHIVCIEDEAYPVLLRSIPDPPPVLYYRGTLEPRDLHSLGIVGSRKCSYYGREQAERFAALLAGAGLTVISGGARGIDSAAHRGAISHPQGRTLAVLGCGVDVTYPPENEPLFRQIAEHGAVVSEHPLGAPPVAENFPRRNRIISGMSRGILVIEADERSGALITARHACEDHNRPVFALPGKVDNPLSAGPHKLIREGATLAANIEHILDGLGPLPREAIDPTPFAAVPPHDSADVPPPEPKPLDVPPLRPMLSPAQQSILDHLGSDPANVDRLVELTALPAHEVLKELTFLTLKGEVKRLDGQTFVRKR